ncbi:non-structural protein NS3 [Grass carp reovirus]|uniref:Non-structural protein NS3 n=1 Tax=Grass carp reovirus TaxID=128987 RepID=A0A172T0W9_GCRV|nr:non-structural protein NS3 [Grass carp reovirus]
MATAGITAAIDDLVISRLDEAITNNTLVQRLRKKVSSLWKAYDAHVSDPTAHELLTMPAALADLPPPPPPTDDEINRSFYATALPSVVSVSDTLWGTASYEIIGRAVRIASSDKAPRLILHVTDETIRLEVPTMSFTLASPLSTGSLLRVTLPKGAIHSSLTGKFDERCWVRLLSTLTKWSTPSTMVTSDWTLDTTTGLTKPPVTGFNARATVKDSAIVMWFPAPDIATSARRAIVSPMSCVFE